MREATNGGQMPALVLDSTMLPHVIIEHVICITIPKEKLLSCFASLEIHDTSLKISEPELK